MFGCGLPARSTSPVGRGATSDAYGGDQIWTGSFKTPGAYYIVVEQTGANEGGYKLSVQ